jgi:hypothetical protein
MKRFVLALLIFLPALLEAQDDRFLNISTSGNGYLQLCQPSAHAMSGDDAKDCVTWMTGVLYGFSAYEAVSGVSLFDSPNNVTVGQARRLQ